MNESIDLSQLADQCFVEAATQVDQSFGVSALKDRKYTSS